MIDAHSLLKKIQDTDRSECDEVLQAEMDRWVKSLEEIEIVRAIVDTDAIKGMLARYREQVKQIETTLLDKRDMTELERLNLLDRKELYKEFINSFDVDNSLERLSKEVNENL